MFSEAQLAYLAYPHYAVVATINADGSPQLSTVWYSFDDSQTRIFFVIEKTSLKARNLARDPRISISVPSGGRYVVLQGTAEFNFEQARDDAQHTLERLAARYYGNIEGHKQVLSFGDKERMTVYLSPSKVNSVGV